MSNDKSGSWFMRVSESVCCSSSCRVWFFKRFSLQSIYTYKKSVKVWWAFVAQWQGSCLTTCGKKLFSLSAYLSSTYMYIMGGRNIVTAQKNLIFVKKKVFLSIVIVNLASKLKILYDRTRNSLILLSSRSY